MNDKPTIIHKKDRSVPKSDAPLATLIQALPKRHQPPLETVRAKCSPLAFAEFILKEHGLITTQKEVDFINGRYATPALKIRTANAVLKSLGLDQIKGSGEWVV